MQFRFPFVSRLSPSTLNNTVYFPFKKTDLCSPRRKKEEIFPRNISLCTPRLNELLDSQTLKKDLHTGRCIFRASSGHLQGNPRMLSVELRFKVGRIADVCIEEGSTTPMCEGNDCTSPDGFDDDCGADRCRRRAT